MGWAAWTLDWRLIGSKLASASLPDMAAMAAAWLAALFIRPVRLLILLGAVSPEVKRQYWPTWSASLIAMAMNSVVPMRAGDMTMAFVLRQGLGVPTARAFSAMLVDRFFDFTTVIVIFVAALAMAPTVVPWAADLSVTLLAALAVLVVGLWLAVGLRRQWLDLFDRLLSALVPRSGEHLRAQVRELFTGVAVVDGLGTMAAVLLLSIGLWGVIIFSYWYGASAVWPSVSFAAAAFAAGAVALSFVVPLAPGGFGVFHAAVVLALSLFGVPAEPALAFAIVAHVFQLGSVLVLAVVAVICQRISIRSLTAIRQTPL
jgi:uncharacterized protein (TIRG00374 family)